VAARIRAAALASLDEVMAGLGYERDSDGRWVSPAPDPVAGGRTAA
jgi:hypothetical protein